jgi:hypothetical protein
VVGVVTAIFQQYVECWLLHRIDMLLKKKLDKLKSRFPLGDAAYLDPRQKLIYLIEYLIPRMFPTSRFFIDA